MAGNSLPIAEKQNSFANDGNDNLTTNTGLGAVENIFHPNWELLDLDPTQNIDEWAKILNVHFFESLLADVKIVWSKRLTARLSIAYVTNGEIEIRLSWPLLRYQTRKLVLEVLLHEMIHAYLVKTNQPTTHGKQFEAKMKEINEIAGTHITITHHLNQNTEEYFFRCIEICPPNYGWATTHAPSTPNLKSGDHGKECDGDFIRVYDTEKVFANSRESIRSNIPLVDDSDAMNLEGHQPVSILRTNSLTANSEILVVDEMFANFHDERKKLLSVESLIVKPVSPNDRNYCMLCQDFVADDQLFQHLFECAGVSVQQIDYKLPFYRIPSKI